MTACGVLMVLVLVIQRPYRTNGPLWRQTEWISSATEDRAVMVEPATADYFRTLQSEAKSAGFQVGNPIIDLSGMGPTTIHMLGGLPVGLPWINGGYPGSRELAVRVLSSVSRADLRRAWVLTSPRGHDHLPTDILNDIGMAFPDDYEEVARAPTGFLSEEHILWRPRRASDVTR